MSAEQAFYARHAELTFNGVSGAALEISFSCFSQPKLVCLKIEMRETGQRECSSSEALFFLFAKILPGEKGQVLVIYTFLSVLDVWKTGIKQNLR